MIVEGLPNLYCFKREGDDGAVRSVYPETALLYVHEGNFIFQQLHGQNIDGPDFIALPQQDFVAITNNRHRATEWVCEIVTDNEFKENTGHAVLTYDMSGTA